MKTPLQLCVKKKKLKNQTIMITTELYNSQQLPFSGLIEKAVALSSKDFDSYVDALLKIRLRRNTKVLDSDETKLLKQIHNAVPASLLRKQKVLSDKMNNSDIGETEYAELMSITQKVEQLNNSRLQYIINLATYKNKGIDEVIEQYELMPKDDE